MGVVDEDEEGTVRDSEAAALARKRRKQRIKRRNIESQSSARMKRRREDDEDQFDDTDSTSEEDRRKPHPTGIKRQARYDPCVKMSKDELKAWRREARRVRNRESAAASRSRTRSRISELEDEVETLTSNLKAALQRIAELEVSGRANDSVQAIQSENDQKDTSVVISPCPSAVPSPVMSPVITPSRRVSFSLDSDHRQEVEKKYQHIMSLIRPPA